MEVHDTPDQLPLIESSLAPSVMCEKRAQVFQFIKSHYHDIFKPEDFQGLYHNQRHGRNNIAPERLSCVLLLEYLTQCSDYEAIDRMMYDLRWKEVLDIPLDAGSEFDRSTLVKFRLRLIKQGKVDTVFRRSIDLCCDHGFLTASEKKKLLVDSMAIFGAGAVKDTYNLLWDGLRRLVREASALLEVDENQACVRLGVDFDQTVSVKAQLDVDWSDALACREALTRLVDGVIGAYDRVFELGLQVALSDSLQFLVDVFDQDIDVDDDPGAQCHLVKGVSRDRLVSSFDQDMRHGRKSRHSRFDGHKLQVGVSGEHGVITSVATSAGNAADGGGLRAVVAEAEAHLGEHVAEIHADRAYDTIENRDWLAESPDREVTDLVCKPRRLPTTGRYTKLAFTVNLSDGYVECPGGNRAVIVKDRGRRDRELGLGCGGTARFAASVCRKCTCRRKCVKRRSKSGRSIRIHAYERLHHQQRQAQLTSEGRRIFRERVAVEHSIACLANQGMRRARYVGHEKLLFQGKWVAAVVNLKKLSYHQFQKAKIS